MKNVKTLLVASAIAATAMTPAFAGSPAPAEDPIVIVEPAAGSSLSPAMTILLLVAIGGAAYALSQNNNTTAP